jgi:hypothetical protein
MSRLIVPRREIITRGPTFRIRVGGRIKLSAMRPDGRMRPLTGWFPNLILDQGLDFLGTSGGTLRMAAGTGNTTPAVTDTQLATQAGVQVANVVSDTNGRQPSEPFFGWRIKVFQSAVGEITGNLAEIGFGPASSDPLQLFARALILDSGGSPTTITVLSDEALNAAYELRYYPPTADVVGSIELDSVSRDYTIRAQDVDGAGSWSSAIGDAYSPAGSGSLTLGTGPLGAAITDIPTGLSAPTGTIANATYTPGNFFRDSTGTWSIGLGQPSGGIGVVQFSGQMGLWGIDFDPKLDKPTDKTLSLTFRMSWDRYAGS